MLTAEPAAESSEIGVLELRARTVKGGIRTFAL